MNEQLSEECESGSWMGPAGMWLSPTLLLLTSFLREECMTHGLHLNSWGRRKLTLLTAKSLYDNQVSAVPSAYNHQCKSLSISDLKAKVKSN